VTETSPEKTERRTCDFTGVIGSIWTTGSNFGGGGGTGLEEPPEKEEKSDEKNPVLAGVF